jgi:hypothetical protein
VLSFRLQGLEDQFDRKSRRRLDGFIVPEGAGSMFKEPEKRDEIEVVQHPALDENTTFYYVMPLSGSAGEVEEHRALTRLPIFVIFHGMAHERGVPPSFTGSSTSLYSPRPLRNKKQQLQVSSGSGPHFPVLASSLQCLSYLLRTSKMWTAMCYLASNLCPVSTASHNILASVMNHPSMLTKL